MVCLTLFCHLAYGAGGTYNVYIDKDNRTATGCTVLQPDFATQFDGIDGYISVNTVGSAATIVGSLYHKCIGGSFDAGSAIVDSALGLNTGMNGEDVFEVQMSTSDLAVSSSTVARLYFSSESIASNDVVVINNSGTAILFGVAFPIPLLSMTSLLLLFLFVLFIAKKALKRKILLTSALFIVSPFVWAMFVFAIDGQVNDWSSFTAIDDPIGDNSAPGNFSDITHVYANLGQNFFTARIDVVDVENQAPTANDVTSNVLEDNSLVVTMTGADADGDALVFIIDSLPSNGLLSVVTPINATSGSVVYTPNNDFNGNDSFTYFANDGQVNSISGTVNITVDPVNDAPSFTTGGTVTVIEESGAYSAPWATNILAGPADENAQTTSFAIVSVTNSTLFSSQPTVDATGNLMFTPAVDEFGTATVTLNISDNGGTANGGVDTSVNQTFDIVIANVNDVPSFTAGANESVVEDAGVQTVVSWATMLLTGPANESSQVLSFNVTNDNNSLFSVQPAINTTGDLTYTSALNENGVATVIVTVMDDGGTANGGVDTSADQSFTIMIRPVNDAPSFTKGSDQTVLEESPAQSVIGWATALSTGPANESTQTTSFNVSNNNNTLFSVQPSVNATGDLSYTPLADASGVAIVTISISDDGGLVDGGVDTSVDQTFTISITDINDVPSFAAGASQTVLEDAGAQSVMAWATALSAGPASESSQTLSFNVTNNNNSLFSTQPTVDSSGNLSYTPAPNANGTATVTLNIMDNGGTANGGIDTSANQAFTITVTAVNDAPSFISGGNITLLEDAAAFNASWASGLSTGPVDESGQTLGFTVTNTNNALFSTQPSLSNTGQLQFTPAAEMNGTATVSVTLTDNGGTANGGNDTSATQIFTISITAVNDAPQFTKGANQSVTQNSGTQLVNGWIAASSVGPANEAGQTLSYNVTNNNNTLFSTQPSVNAAGDLSYTSATNQNGVATVTINVMDDGGTANGGVDTSPIQTFTITITNPPPAKANPSYGVTTNIQINVPSGSGLLNGATGGTGALTVGNAMNPAPTTTVNGGNLSIITATGVFTYNPPAGLNTGTDTFIYKICDSLGICSADITTTFNLSGNTIWFIDKAAVAGGDGRLTTPFNSVAGFAVIQGVIGTAGAAASDYIYLKAGNYIDGFSLLANQMLLGDGTSGSFDAITGINPSGFSVARPALGGSKPVISSPGNGVSVSTSNVIRGVEVGNTTNYAIQGSSVAGILTITDVDVSGTGGLVDLNGSTTGVLNASFGKLDSSASTSNPVLQVQGFASGNFTVDTAGTTIVSTTQATNFVNNLGVNFAFNGTAGLSINSGVNDAFVANNGGNFGSSGNGTVATTTGVAINLSNGTAIAASNLTFNSISSDGSTNGIILDSLAGTGTFTITGTGSTNGSGGTIQNNSVYGILVKDSNNINLNNMNFTNATNESVGCLADVGGVTGTCHAAIELDTVNNISLTNVSIDGNGDTSDELGIFGQNVSNFDMNNVTVQNVSDAIDEHGIYIVNLLGSAASSSRWQNITVNNTIGDTAILLVQTAGMGELLIDGSTIISNALDGGFEARTTGATAGLIITIDGITVENTSNGASFFAENGTIDATIRNSILQPGAGLGSINRVGSGTNGVMFVGITGQSTNVNSSVDLTVNNNTNTQEDGGAGGTGRSVNALGGSSNINGLFNSNIISSNDEFVDGIFANFTGTGTVADNVITITNNNFNMSGAGTNQTIAGIEINASDSTGGLTASVKSNTILYAGANGFSAGMVFVAGDTAGGDNNTLCTDVLANDVDNVNAGSFGHYGFVQFSSATKNIQGLPVGVVTDGQVDTFITTNDVDLNDITTGADVNATVGAINGVVSCL